MAYLDRLLDQLAQPGAVALRLEAGLPALVVLHGGGTRPATRDPLSAPQVLQVARETIPSGAVAPDGTAPATWRYRPPAGGPVAITLAPGPAGPVLEVSRDDGAASVAAAADAAPDPAGPARLDALLGMLAATGASDLHLRSGEPPVLRLHGDLARHGDAPVSADALEAMLLAAMGGPERALFLERMDVDWTYEIPGAARFRVNAGRDRRGPFAVARVIPTRIPDVDEIGLAPEVQRLCQLTKGLVLVTGPTGSGKSTTIAAMVDLINRTRADHVLIVEEPIEFVHEARRGLITQREVGRHTRSFESALRAGLREDPDVVVVGELRDLETASIAIETAETGHLVLATLHTATAASTVERLIDQFPVERQGQVRAMLAESLKGVVSQTLCRRIGGGRVAAREVLIGVPAIANLIREGKTFQIPSIMQTGRRVGMVGLNTALLELVEQGLVSPEEAYRRAADKASMLQSLQQKGKAAGLGDIA